MLLQPAKAHLGAATGRRSCQQAKAASAVDLAMQVSAIKVRGSSARASFGIGAAAAAAFARGSKSSRRGRNAGQRAIAPRPTEDRRSPEEAEHGVWRTPATEVSAVPHQPSANSSSCTHSNSSQQRGAPAASLRAKAESDAGRQVGSSSDASQGEKEPQSVGTEVR